MSNEEFIKKYNRLNPQAKKEIDKMLDELVEQPAVEETSIPLFGLLKGKIKMAPDFDEPLEDFKEYMP